MITFRGCTQKDIETILKAEPMNKWLNEVRQTIVEICGGELSEERIIDRVQMISMHIWRRGQRLKQKTIGQLMNATWSDQYFTINIPGDPEGWGIIRIEGLRHVHFIFDKPVVFMSVLGLGPLQVKEAEFQGIKMTVKHAAFLVWCEAMKAGLSGPFLDMIQDGEL